MKLLKYILNSILILFVMITFSQCASSKRFESHLPLEISDVYYQSWISGVEGGGSGLNLFIPIESNPKNIILDSVFFKGKQAKLEYRNNSVFIGRFKTEANQKHDIVMSSDPIAEYANKVPEIPKKVPFELKDDECVVSYLESGKVKYFKIEKIKRKESKFFQSAPPKKQ